MMNETTNITRVLLNLAMNAVDAMRDVDPDRRTLELHVEHGPRDQLHFSICDQGSGLAQEDCERVFDAFYTTKHDGMGIGLAISRSIIEAHDGGIWVCVNPQLGATFHFTLPCGYKEN